VGGLHAHAQLQATTSTLRELAKLTHSPTCGETF
jgi:hypothetical protein